MHMNDRTVRVKVLFFASTRELVGQQSIEVGLEEGATVDDLLNRLQGFYPKLQSIRALFDDRREHGVRYPRRCPASWR